MKQLVIIGAGGFGREVLWAAIRCQAEQAEFVFAGFCDDAPARQSGTYCDLPLLGSIEKAAAELHGQIYYVCAIGTNEVRAKVVARATQVGWIAQTVIDPSVPVASGVVVGEGSYIGALSILAPAAQVGRHVIVNYGASIGHDSRLGDFAQVCPGGRITGFSVLGEGAFVGSNAVVAPGVKLGAWAKLGACSFAIRAIAAGNTAVGNPARTLFATATPQSKS